MKTIRCLTFFLGLIAVISLAIHFGFGTAAATLPAAASGFVLVAHGGAGESLWSSMEMAA